MNHFKEKYRQVEQYIHNELGLIPQHIKEPLEYAVQDGKRLRPILCLDIAEHISKKHQAKDGIKLDYLSLAIATEWIHTASLIVDDLPSMDNDIVRRGRDTVHVRFGERVAQELQMYLVAKGIDCVRHEFITIHDQTTDRIRYMLTTIFDNLGMNGSPRGQLLDIQSNDDWETVIQKKTGTFFEISFVLGYIGGGGDLDKIQEIKTCSHYLGTLYQIMDDFLDQEEDRKKKCINSFLILGQSKALQTYQCIEKKLITLLQSLDIYTPVFKDILKYLKIRLPFSR